MPLNTVLERYGLTEKQAAVYLATLELGRAAVVRIADKAAIKRPTAYVVLNELLQMGLVEITPRGSTKYYQAADPQALLSEVRERARLLEQSLPELRALLNTAVTKPKVRFYEGKRGIYQLYHGEILRQREMFSLVNLHEFAKTYSEREMIALLDRMKESGMKAKELLDDSPEGRWYLKEKNARQLGDTRFLPKKFSFEVDFLVYGNTIAMVSLKNLVAVVVEDPTISKAQLQILGALWDSTGNLDSSASLALGPSGTAYSHRGR